MPFTDIPLIEIILGTIAFVIIFAFGLAVYLKNPKSHTSVLFFILALLLDAYIIANAIALHPIIKTFESQLFWIRIDMFLGAFMAPILFLLAHTFPDNTLRIRRKYLIATCIYTAIIASISLTFLIFKSVGYPNGSLTPVPVPGPGMPLYFIHFVGYCTLSFIVLIRRYKKGFGQEKIKTLYFLVGIIATFSLITLFNFLAVIFFGYTGLVFLGPVYPVIMMVLIGIAIVKHHFLDIKPIIARAVSYTFLLAILAGVYFILLFAGFSKFLGLTLDTKAILINVSIGVLVVLTFQPLRSFIIKATDKLFFKKAYNPEQMMSDLTHAISNTINFDDLADKLLSTIVQEFRAGKTALFLVSKETVIDARSIGYTNTTVLDDSAQLFALLHQAQNKEKHFFTIDEAAEDQKQFFRTHDIEALFPIEAENECVAILLLGTKSSGLPYSTQDLNLLEVFASESGIAIQNAELYTNLKIALDSKTRFINVVSHQLRTPISGIRWNLEELKSLSVEHVVNAEALNLVNLSHQKIIFLNEQLDDILIVLDIHDKKIVLNKAPCDILTMAQKVVASFDHQVSSNKLEASFTVPEEVRTVVADPEKLKKVFEVLIKNAIVYSNNGGHVLISARGESSTNGKQVVITIVDQGLGITENEKASLFKEFFRGDRSRLKVPDGLGLGMFIAKTFVEEHSGSITITSAGADKGTEITFSLPL